MAQIKHIRGDTPNDPSITLTLPGYSMKRGKVLPTPKSSWDTRGGDGQPLDTESGKKHLDECLGD